VKKKSPKKKLKIEQAAVDAFSRKLKEWSKSLPEEERNLMRLLVERATTVNVADLGGYDLRAKIRPEAAKLFKSLRSAVQSLPAVTGVNLDPDGLWLKSTATRPPGWTQASSIIVDPGVTRTRGGGNQ
jgi:hypothetical protein